MTGIDEVHAALDSLLEGTGHVLLTIGPPRSGKTRFAVEALRRGLARFGDTGAVMTVPGRQSADEIGNEVIRALGSSGQARPVTTLPAVAFRVLDAARAGGGDPSPRLLNGAEQDALLRSVLSAHLAHARAGDDCATCTLLRSYFAQDDWADAIAAHDVADDGPEGPGDARGGTEGVTTATVLARGVSDEFVSQLRDMLARMDELGADEGREDALLEVAGDDGRLRLQWRLAFALRREYRRAVAHAYPGQRRLDASRLLVDAAAVLPEGDPPAMLVVDDFQDTTLAGMRFLEALAAAGTTLVLVGNPDEAVQTFRGSHPEHLVERAVHGPLSAVVLPLGNGDGPHGDDASYRRLAAARVSLSIPSPVEDPLPLAKRPGKLAPLPGALPIASLDGDDPLPGDGTLHAALYRSPREELDDVCWRIKHAHLDGDVPWNDMAVIAHDNATVRAFGERLRRDGVPVRYSSVTRPLRDEPFVQGLFALVELARLRRRDARDLRMPLAAVAAYARPRVAALMESPLVSAGGRAGRRRAGRMGPVVSAMDALAALGRMLDGDGHDGKDAGTADEAARGRLPAIVDAWRRLGRSVEEAHERRRDGERTDEVDDSLVDGTARTGDVWDLDADALLVMLALDDPLAPADAVASSIGDVLGRDPQAKAFARLWTLVDGTARALSAPGVDGPAQTLAAAWDTADVARRWQREALDNTPEGRAANDRLDAAMRLFQAAEDATSGEDVATFIARVRGMQIEADSLAHVGPVEQAVTLATPAGAAGRHWPLVWMPAIQQDVWPNLAARGTMFGGEELDAAMLRGIGATADGIRAAGAAEVLSGEKKGLLVALTRADRSLTVSAVWNDELTPSDFLFGYLPERYPRDRALARFTDAGDGDASWGGLDADPRGLVAACRLTLARSDPGSPAARDAAEALALLARHGIDDADPDSWDFLDGPTSPDESASAPDGPAPATRTVDAADAAESADDDAPPTVSLSPSGVDGLWGCPVCWLLENRFGGPRRSTAATGFGTLIHEVARLATEEGLDLPAPASDADVPARTEAIAARLGEIYRSLRQDPDAIPDVRQRYQAIRKDRNAEAALASLAGYFAGSSAPGYLQGNAKYFSVGRLTASAGERSFTARLGLDDILAAYRAMPAAADVTRGELAACLGTLVGGWPEGMREDLTIRLSGRIDRMEVREGDDGARTVRLIDYKTGRLPHTKQIVNDLQLVCYQLGLVFPEGGPRGADALAVAPDIAQSALFHVEHRSAPGESRSPEGLFQPPLFADGALNASPYTRRDGYPKQESLLDLPDIAADRPDGVREGTWRAFRALAGTQTLWALTMVARVFYAAAATRSATLVAHPTAQHLGNCRFRSVCPACAGRSATVYETRQP